MSRGVPVINSLKAGSVDQKLCFASVCTHVIGTSIVASNQNKLISCSTQQEKEIKAKHRWLYFICYVSQGLFLFFDARCDDRILSHKKWLPNHAKQVGFVFIINRCSHAATVINTCASRIYVNTTVDASHRKKMSSNTTLSLLALPVELIYRILDCLDPKDIFLSARDLCQRLDSITDTYHPYQVSLKLQF